MGGKIILRDCLAVLFFLLLIAKLGLDLQEAISDPAGANLAGDVMNYAWPLLEHVHISLSQGNLPLWNPFLSFGSPVMGELGLALFFPVHWLVFVFEVPIALLLIQFVTLAIAAVGMYRYGQFLDMAFPATLLATGLFVYIVYTESFHHSLGSSICLLPWILRAAQVFVTSPDLRKALVLGIYIALCFLAGFPNYFFYTVLITALTCLLLSFSEYGTQPVRYYTRLLFCAGVGALLFMGLVAVQLLSTLELVSESVRSLEAGRIYNPNSLFEFFSLNTVWRDMFATTGANLYGNTMLKLDVAVYYLGAAVMLTPIAIISKHTRRYALVFLASVVLLVLFVLSYKVSALWFLQEIPLAKSLRMNGRVVAYLQALLAILAGLGLTGLKDWLAGRDGYERIKVRFLVPLVAGLGIFTYGLATGHSGSSILMLLTGLALLLYLFSPLRQRASHLITWTIALCVLVDVSVQRDYRILVPAFLGNDDRSLVTSAEALRAADPNTRILFATNGIRNVYPLQNLGSSLQINNIGAYTNFTLARWRNLARELTGPEAFDRVVANSIQPRFYGEITPLLKDKMLANSAGMDILSLAYVISDAGGVSVRAGSMPRAYTVTSYTMAASEEEALEQIRSGLGELSSSVVLEGESPSFPSAAVQEPAVKAAVNYVGTNRVEMRVDLDSPAILVLTDAFFPGWQARLDGEPVEILRANSLFRAVAVDAGAHTVEFIYRPSSLYLGVALSALSLFIAVIVLARLPRHKDVL